MFPHYLVAFLVEKLKNKIVACFYEIPYYCNCENPSSNPIRENSSGSRLCHGQCRKSAIGSKEKPEQNRLSEQSSELVSVFKEYFSLSQMQPKN
jgi:hypothetical protein